MPPLRMADILNPLQSSSPSSARTDSVSSGTVTGPSRQTPPSSDRRSEYIDIRPQIAFLVNMYSHPSPILAPAPIVAALSTVVDFMHHQIRSPQAVSIRPVPLGRSDSPSPSGSSARTPSPGLYIHERNVPINRQTTLVDLFRYPEVNTVVEYPQSSTEGPVGHLFRVDPSDWVNPSGNIAYSRGHPSGASLRSETIFCNLLVDYNGNKVPCYRRHDTCQGSKVCPFVNVERLSVPHTCATRADISQRLLHDREYRLQYSSPSRDIFLKTAAFITALRSNGCGFPQYEATIIPESEHIERASLENNNKRRQRGYQPQSQTCLGHILMDYNEHGKPLVICEHYNKKTNRDHMCQFLDDSYDHAYIEAFLNEDSEELDRIESVAQDLHYGPLATCSTVSNVSSQRLICSHDHRDTNGRLSQPDLIRLECGVRFRFITPIEEYRSVCPFVLVIVDGAHPHPIPLPEKTPMAIRAQIIELLHNLNEDLPDMTPRRFMRHPLVKAHLRTLFPEIAAPTLSNWHVSLANRAHLKSYIGPVQERVYPHGTGWNGVVHLKEAAERECTSEERYVRRIIKEDTSTFDSLHSEDEPRTNLGGPDKALRIIICMSPEGSRRLLQSQYIQSDISFKRVPGFYEFEMACIERNSNTSLIFCRVFINCQTADAHARVFAEIEDIVYEDTSQHLAWRHLHADSINEVIGILHWTVDQHGGQAKGLGLHLQRRAQELPGRRDLHEPHRFLSELSPYEHIHRILRLCVVHLQRNIRTCPVSEEVRHLMRSLICLEHPDWNGTIASIQRLGGKAGTDWVQDKIRSKFAFQAMSWSHSHIPKDIWMAGESNSNLIESVHADVNREGVSCTLIGGIQKGRHFDAMKMAALKAFESAGIRPSYKSGHLVDNAVKNLKRKTKGDHSRLMAEDGKIAKHNNKIQRLQENVDATHSRLQSCVTNHNLNRAHTIVEKAQVAHSQALAARDKVALEGKELFGTGSGKTGISMPTRRM